MDKQEISKQYSSEQRKIFRFDFDGKAYLHKEGTIRHFREPVKIRDLNFSCFLKSIKESTFSLLPRGDWWVVLPAFLKDKTNCQLKEEQKLFPKISDVQLGITGRLKKEEKPGQATIRKVKEEIGLDIVQQDIKWGPQGQMRYVWGRKYCKIYPSVIMLEKVQKPNTHFEKNETVLVDKRRASIQTWLLVKNFQQIKDYNFLNRKRNRDTAGEIVAIMKVQHLINILKQLRYQIFKGPKNEQQNIQENELKHSEEKIVDLSQLRGILDCQTQQQCTKINQKIQKMQTYKIEQFIKKYHPHFKKMMCHYAAKEIISYLIDNCNQEQRNKILQIIYSNFMQILLFNQSGSLFLTSVIKKNFEKQQFYDEAFKLMKGNLVQVAKNKHSNHFIKGFIQKCPIDLVISIYQEYIKDKKIFFQMISGKWSTTVMQFLLKTLAQEAKDYMDSQKIMVKYLEDFLAEDISKFGRFFIGAAYKNLPKQLMLKITEELFENFEKFSYKNVQLMVDCVVSVWNDPYYIKFYDKLAQKLSEAVIKCMYESEKPQKVLRKLFRTKQDLKIKDKIASVVWDMPIIHFQPGWKYTMRDLKLKYEKVNGVLMKKNIENI